MSENSYGRGQIAQNFFEEILTTNNISWSFVDVWYDYLINDKHKVEVKSCRLVVKDGNVTGYRYGRFDFTDEDNRNQQYQKDIWICFIVRHEESCMILGFVNAKQLKKNRYISLVDLRKLDMINFESWKYLINKGKKQVTENEICNNP